MKSITRTLWHLLIPGLKALLVSVGSIFYFLMYINELLFSFVHIIVSPETAESCGLMRLLDTRFNGVAKGVGTAKILGRIHSAQMRLSKNFFLSCSFIVVEGKGSELLFGLDMLKKHRACIDLRKNALTFDSEDIPFLAEHELPEKQRRMEVSGFHYIFIICKIKLKYFIRFMVVKKRK